MRFRNRFKGTPAEVLVCGCGLPLAVSVVDGRETVIHVQPWCEGFEALVAELGGGDPTVQFHVAVVDTALEMTIVADGDSTADVRDPLKER